MGDDQTRNPNTFIMQGDRVRAKVTIFGNNGTIADPGDEGVCIGKGSVFWPAVKFDKSGMTTDVTPQEVEKI